MKSISHGVLIFNGDAQLLLCHATGSPYWDIPKGGGTLTETGRQTAVRETFEECGLRLAPEDLLPLGCFAYRAGKDLQLYAVLTGNFDAHACTCASQFVDRRGRPWPEMDAYRWAGFDELPQWCAKSLVAVLTRALSLRAILAQLQALKQRHTDVDPAQGHQDFIAQE
jgi:8-oxo-dGTP pyrophosphatase MutT (NUDIX family)